MLTQAEWNDFFRGLNKVSSDNVDLQCGVCPKACGGIAGHGWKRAIKEYIEQVNTKYAGRVMWSYERHLVGGNTDGRTIHNRLDISWQAPMAVAAPIVQVVERGCVKTRRPALVAVMVMVDHLPKLFCVGLAHQRVERSPYSVTPRIV